MDGEFLDGISLRCRSLELAIALVETGTETKFVLETASLFEAYMRKGERPSAEVKGLRTVKP